MKDNTKVVLYTAESTLGYKLTEKFVPKTILLKQFNPLVLGIAVSAVGILVVKGEVLAVGLGSTFEGILSLVGMQ
jgi:hypothetical protein